MCNLYSQTSNQDAIQQLFDPIRMADEAWTDTIGNLPPLTNIWPDMQAPIIRRNQHHNWQFSMARWGMPTPTKFLKGKRTDKGVTNIRNTQSRHWQRWLGVEHRCLVPFTSFSELDKRYNAPPNSPVWFTLRDDQPLAFFAGLWTEWTSIRTLKEGRVTTELFGFLTCEPNTDVATIHPKAMPVILTKPNEWRFWLTASAKDVMRLQRPFSNGMLKVISQYL